MKASIKTTLFIALLITVVVYSKSISSEIVESYNNCIHFIANNSTGSSLILGA